MEACAVICRKATVALLDANPFIFEHINDIFVRFCPSGPLFSGISSTKSRFLCFFGLRNPRFRAFRAQKRGVCALLGWGTLVFWPFEHKIGIFVLGRRKRGIGKRNHGDAFASFSRWWFLRAYCHRDYLLYLTSTQSHSLSPG